MLIGFFYGVFRGLLGLLFVGLGWGGEGGGGGRLGSGIDTVSGLYIYWAPVGLGRVELITFTTDCLGWCWWGCTCITTDLDSISTYDSGPHPDPKPVGGIVDYSPLRL